MAFVVFESPTERLALLLVPSIGYSTPSEGVRVAMTPSTRWLTGWYLLASLAIVVVVVVVGVLLVGKFPVPALLAIAVSPTYGALWRWRAALTAQRMVALRVAHAARGLVALQGVAMTSGEAVPAGISGRPSVWWDVSVENWSEDSDGGDWAYVLSRHGGSTEALVLQDPSGQAAVWLRDAEIMLQEQSWTSTEDDLPEAGVALCGESGWPWDGRRPLRVRETRVEVGAPLYVLGTVTEARALPPDGEPQERSVWALRANLRSGVWGDTLQRTLPAFIAIPVLVAVKYFGLLGGIACADVRRPELPPDTKVIWKGRLGRPFVVSDSPQSETIRQLQKQALWYFVAALVLVAIMLSDLG